VLLERAEADARRPDRCDVPYSARRQFRYRNNRTRDTEPGPDGGQLITDTTTISSADLWGYDDATVPDWTTQISGVPEFLRRSGIDYVEMMTLLTTSFANEDRSVGVIGPADDLLTCELDRLTITGLNELKLSRMMRFIRLWRRCGWSMLDLDRALTALGGADIDLKSLAIVKALNDRLRTDLPEILVWWGDIDTTAYPDVSAPGRSPLPTLHDRLFSPTRSLRSAKAEVALTVTKGRARRVRALAADVDVLTDEQIISTADILAPDDIPLLSLLFGTARSRGRCRSMSRRCCVVAVTGRSPFGDPATTLAFVAAVDRLRSTPFTIDEVEYLLGTPSSVASAPAMTAEAVAESLSTLDAELRAIATRRVD